MLFGATRTQMRARASNSAPLGCFWSNIKDLSGKLYRARPRYNTLGTNTPVRRKTQRSQLRWGLMLGDPVALESCFRCRRVVLRSGVVGTYGRSERYHAFSDYRITKAIPVWRTTVRLAIEELQNLRKTDSEYSNDKRSATLHARLNADLSLPRRDAAMVLLS